jgi:hypothetical protein
LTLFFDAGETEAAEVIESACERSIQLMRELWGLEVPEECRVYVMSSWLHFVFHSAPWPWRILLGVTIPLWVFRVRKLWSYAGGWAQKYGRRRAVGVKPPRLIESSDRRLGERIFNQTVGVNEKVQHITCHELVHAFTAHLKLPAWLNEGVAMVTVDRFVGEPTVKEETIAALAQRSGRKRPKGYGRLGVRDSEGLVYHYVRGYWITRYLVETQPGLLKSLLGRRRSRKALESELAGGLGVSRESFWEVIDGMVVSHVELARESGAAC